MAYNFAGNYLIAGNDEHGINPPTLGKRTPVMPYIERSIYENEFNFAAKNYFLADCLRIGFYILDVKPNRQDISVSARVAIVNRSSPSALVTFAYNAYGNGEEFNSANGLEVFYSPLNYKPAESQTLAYDVYDNVLAATGSRGRGVKTLDVAMLSSVRTVACLIEAGFMTNFEEAKNMLNPDFQKKVGTASCKGVCEYFNVRYVPIEEMTFPLLRKGSTGSFVRYLQFVLQINGYNPGSYDGIFGNLTQNAVLSFQQANGLVADGIVGPKTWEKINNLNPENRVLKLGSYGVEVKYLQQKLLSKLYNVGNIDGIFGKQTQDAVKAFQMENGLIPDGIVGVNTWKALLNDNNSRPLP